MGVPPEQRHLPEVLLQAARSIEASPQAQALARAAHWLHAMRLAEAEPAPSFIDVEAALLRAVACGSGGALLELDAPPLPLPEGAGPNSAPGQLGLALAACEAVRGDLATARERVRILLTASPNKRETLTEGLAIWITRSVDLLAPRP